MKSPIHRFGLTAALFTSTLWTGCGGSSLVQITGKISVDGTPAEGALLLFHPVDNKQAPVATGVADNNGSYTLTSNVEAGITPGKYQVTVSWPEPTAKPKGKEIMMSSNLPEPGLDRLKGRYISKDKSGLSLDITASTRELPPFDLKTK